MEAEGGQRAVEEHLPVELSGSLESGSMPSSPELRRRQGPIDCVSDSGRGEVHDLCRPRRFQLSGVGRNVGQHDGKPSRKIGFQLTWVGKPGERVDTGVVRSCGNRTGREDRLQLSMVGHKAMESDGVLDSQLSRSIHELRLQWPAADNFSSHFAATRAQYSDRFEQLANTLTGHKVAHIDDALMLDRFVVSLWGPRQPGSHRYDDGRRQRMISVPGIAGLESR